MKCRLCRAKNLNKLEGKNLQKGNYYHCGSCDLIFLPANQMPPPSKERQRYLEHDNTFATSGYVSMFEDFIADYIKPYKSKITTALDFGCGPGPVLAAMLKEEGIKVDIYDPYFFPGEKHLKNQYDLITSTEVFEHLTRPAQEIRKLLDLLRPDKYLALMTSLHPGPQKLGQWNYRKDDTHITFYSWETMNWIEKNFPVKIIKSDKKKNVLLQKLGE